MQQDGDWPSACADSIRRPGQAAYSEYARALLASKNSSAREQQFLQVGISDHPSKILGYAPISLARRKGQEKPGGQFQRILLFDKDLKRSSLFSTDPQIVDHRTKIRAPHIPDSLFIESIEFFLRCYCLLE